MSEGIASPLGPLSPVGAIALSAPPGCSPQSSACHPASCNIPIDLFHLSSEERPSQSARTPVTGATHDVRAGGI